MLVHSDKFSDQFKLTILFASILFATFVAFKVQADVDLGADEAEIAAEAGGAELKAIRVDTPQTEPLMVVLEPSQDTFKVDEPIYFKIRGNKDFFLYLFNIDGDTEQATLILPSKDGQKHNKYPANQTLRVPNRGEPPFLSDTPGRETLVMVASTRYLPLKSNWFRDGAESYIDQALFEEEFVEKGIRVGNDRTQDDKVQVKRLTVHIRSENSVVEGADTPVWLTTKGNRTEYALGDRIETVFGAAADGWVQMYVIEPTGDRIRLKSLQVKADRAYTMNAVATDPAGKHAFVAFYSEDEPGEDSPRSERDKSLLDAMPKGVRVVDDASSMMAVYRFRISE